MRKTLFLAMLLIGLGGIGSGTSRAADSAVILMYHRFGDDRFPAANTRLEQLDAHIAELKAGSYHVMPLPAVIEAFRTGRKLPEKAVAITIDDAWSSVAHHAWPRLKAAGLPFTLFVVTDETDRGGADYMGWDTIRELAASGLVTIGSQGAGHPHMPVLSKGAVVEDLARSRARFIAELGRAPDLFAWPYGEMSREAAEMVKEAGFVAAFGQHSGPAWRRSDPWFLPRFALNEAYGEPERFRLAARSLPLPVMDITPSDPKLVANPPHFGFTLAEDLTGLDHLACYTSHAGAAAIERLGPRIEIRLAKPFPAGRGRINCTAPSLDGRWRWFGWQFFVER